MVCKKNFLITYSGRVGSTALIDTLKAVPGVIVPIFEELDYFAIELSGKLGLINRDNIQEHINAVYLEDRDGISSTNFSIGFKWRIWGDMAKLAPILNLNNVMVLNMTRADIAEFISSLYISDIVHGEFNSPQFLLRDADNDVDRSKILARYRDIRYEVDLDLYFSLAEVRLAEERNRLNHLGMLTDLGIPVFTILYEDFAYKRHHFLEGLLSALGLPPVRNVPIIQLSKVSTAFPSELMINRNDLLLNDRMHELRSSWEDLLYNTRFPLLPLGRLNKT